MIVTQDGASAPHVPARHGRHAGAAAARRDGAGAVARGPQTVASSVRRLGFVYIPMGMNAAAWTPAARDALTSCRRRCSR